MFDFTLRRYSALIGALGASSFRFQTLSDFVQNPKDKSVCLRHDVDARPSRSLAMARLEQRGGIKGTYYFRMGVKAFDEGIIREIADLGHEIGYHYETMDTCQGNVDRAYDAFCRNLERLRAVAPIQTICMHGSPRCDFDNRAIWEKYEYRSLGILAEPYLDVDYASVFYLTDTGRRWDGFRVSLRDKIPGHQDRWVREGLVFRSTSEIIRAAREGRLPGRILVTVHPQRWSSDPLSWAWEALFQKLKNVYKYWKIGLPQ